METTQYALRVPVVLYERIREIADKDGRSINSQIVHVLGEWVEEYDMGVRRLTPAQRVAILAILERGERE